jgi:hypothetical protein
MFSMFQTEGTVLNLAATTSRPTIPWVEVLTSPYNMAFNVIFLLGITTYLVRRRKAGARIGYAEEVQDEAMEISE